MAHAMDFDPKDYDALLDIYDSIVEKVGKERCEVQVGIICGSGLGMLANMLEDKVELPYSEIPGFPIPSVPGHKGNLVFGKMHGMNVVCQQGRFHPYEHDMNLHLCSTPVRIMHLLGVQNILVSNAAGGINQSMKFGDLMIINDHIFLPGLSGFSPLVGVHDKRFGPRFVSVHDCYDYALRLQAREVAKEHGFDVFEGIYVMSGGPQYETPGEVRLFKTVGADALGMSTAHEVTVARQLKIRVFGFSLITNIANLDVDSAVVVSHEEVLQNADAASERASRFASEMIRRMKITKPKEPALPRIFERHRPRKV